MKKSKFKSVVPEGKIPPDSDFDPEQLAKGIEIEMEHSGIDLE